MACDHYSTPDAFAHHHTIKPVEMCACVQCFVISLSTLRSAEESWRSCTSMGQEAEVLVDWMGQPADYVYMYFIYIYI